MVSTRLMSSVGVNGVTTHSEAPNIQPGTSRQSARIQAVERSTDPLNLNNIDNHEDEIITSTETASSQRTIFFLDLPQEIIEKIFSYLSFKNVAHLRPVSHAMDQICGNVLNGTFQKLQKQMLIRFQNIKAKMPRRESARRNHPLACESDIIETLHMRLTLLQMSFGKHIERRHCCFFAGEVLDEVYRILHYIKKTTKLQRPYKVTDELFDLSSMAMEYFKEHIEPRLPEIAYFTSDFLDFTGNPFSRKLILSGWPAASSLAQLFRWKYPKTFLSCLLQVKCATTIYKTAAQAWVKTTGKRKTYMCLDSSPLGAGSSGEQKDDETPIHQIQEQEPSYMPTENLPQSNMVLRKRIRKIKQGMKRYNSQLSLLRQDLRSCKRKTAEQQKQIAEQQRQLAEQQKQTLEYATRLDENDKKNEETSRKFGTLLQELNKCKTELQYWRSKSPAMPPVCKGCGNVFTPVPAEDLQVLVNQGIRPEGLGLLPEYPVEGGPSTEEIEMQPASGIEVPIQSPLPLEPSNVNIIAAAESSIDISPPQSPSQHTRQQGTKRKQPTATTSSKRLPKRKK